jgi:hypothetical protein
MYYTDGNQVFSQNGIVYRKIFSDLENISNGRYEIKTVDNHVLDNLFQTDLDIIDLCHESTYLRIIAQLKYKNIALYNRFKTIIASTEAGYMLYNVNDNYYNEVMYEFILFLKDYNIDGYYLSNLMNSTLNIINSHIYFII